MKQSFINNVRISGITSTSASVTWSTTGAADSQIEYGLTQAYGNLTPLNSGMVRAHSEVLSGLTPNTLYHLSVMSRAAAGNLVTAGDFTFATTPVIVAGMVGTVSVSGISPTSAVVSWPTDVPANSLVEFGETILYGQSSALATAFVTSHSATLSGLTPGATYHVRAKSGDRSGNLGISDDATFVTSEDDSPSIFGAITASAIEPTSATITWVTTSPASSQVDYGTGTSYGNSTPTDAALVTSHAQVLTGLTPNALYHFRVNSATSGGSTQASSDFTFATTPVRLFYPQLSPDQDSYTGIAVSNPDAGSAQLSFTAFEATGLELNASALTNPVSQTLAAGAQFAAIQDQIFGMGASASWPLGWVMIESPNPQVTGFFLTFNSSLSFMDGTQVSSRTLGSFVLPETGNQDYTTLLFANPNDADASIAMDLVKTDGTVRSTTQAAILPYSSYSPDLVTGVFAGVAADPSDYVRVRSSQGLIAYEYLGNVSKDFAVLPALDPNDAGTTVYSPQYVFGGPWYSTLTIVNLDPVSGTVALKWIGDDGTQIGSTRTVSVSGGGKIYISDPSFFLGSPAVPAQITGGYVQADSSGIRMAGSVIFSDALKGEFMTALPLVSTLRKAQVLSHVASNDTYFTGISIMNPNSAAATVTIELFTASGNLAESTTRVIPAGHRTSELVTQYFPDQVGQDWHSGYIRVTSDNGVACFGVFGTQSLSVLAAIPAQAAQ